MKKEQAKKGGGLPFKATNQRFKGSVAAMSDDTQRAISVISRLPVVTIGQAAISRRYRNKNDESNEV